MVRFLNICCLLLILPLFSGCEKEEEVFEQRTGLKEFIPRYNKYIQEWVAGQLADVEKEIAEEEKKLAEADTDELRKFHQEALVELATKKERFVFRQNIGDYFSYKTLDDIPKGLVWENGLDQPEIGDPAAKKGGTFRYFIDGFAFPATLRQFGPNASGGMRSELYDDIQVGLVGIHPTTGGIMPGIAREWAEGPDKRTVYYRIDQDARYANGDKPKMEDFFRAIWVRVSDNVVEPYGKQYFREQFAQICIYDEETISVTLPSPRPLLPYYTGGGFDPVSERFYSEYGPDFEERYNWRVQPTLGAYYVKDEDVKKGVSITLTRVKDWWGDKKKFYRYRYNPDRIVYTLVRDRPKSWELFRAGELDYYPITEPEYWYEKSEMPPVFDGYVEKRTWYNQYPRPPRGLYINTHYKPLDQLDVRIGFSHAVNWQKVIDVVFRGDYERLPSYTQGYGRFDNKAIQERKFSISKAREYFAKAGFDREGGDGILLNKNGERLEIPLSYMGVPVVQKMMTILKEEARKTGLDLILEPLEWAVLIKKVDKKEHHVILLAFGSTPPLPRYYELLHSRNAYDEKGNLKQNTNNLMSYVNEDVDKLCVTYRNAQDLDEVERLAHQLQKIIHDEALYVPGYMTPYKRIATWRWVRWPKTEQVHVAPPGFDLPIESYCFWIDEEMKAETLAARKSGKTFPEVSDIADEFRSRPSSEKPQEEAEPKEGESEL